MSRQSLAAIESDYRIWAAMDDEKNIRRLHIAIEVQERLGDAYDAWIEEALPYRKVARMTRDEIGEVYRLKLEELNAT